MVKEREIKIGLIGTIGSGKTTVSEYLKKKGFSYIATGDIVREKAREEGIELTRENLQQLQKKYRAKYGMDCFTKIAIERLEKGGKGKLAVDGMRVPEETFLVKKHGFKIILIDAPARIRFERLKLRGSARDPKRFMEFIKNEKAEWKLFRFGATIKDADYKINNSGSMKNLYRKIDKLIK